MDFTTRPVEERDAPGIADLLNAIIDAGGLTVMPGPVTGEAQRTFIRGLSPHDVFFAAFDDAGALLGIQDVLRFFPDSPVLGHIGEVSTFVNAAARGRGVGAALCRATFPAARERGVTKLQAMIRADNPGALDFYRSQGFRVVGTAHRHARVGDLYVDEVLTEKLLD